METLSQNSNISLTPAATREMEILCVSLICNCQYYCNVIPFVRSPYKKPLSFFFDLLFVLGFFSLFSPACGVGPLLGFAVCVSAYSVVAAGMWKQGSPSLMTHCLWALVVSISADCLKGQQSEKEYSKLWGVLTITLFVPCGRPRIYAKSIHPLTLYSLYVCLCFFFQFFVFAYFLSKF